MEFATIYNVCVASSVIYSVIDFKMVLMAYCKKRKPYFEWRISYGNVAKVLADEEFQVAKQMVRATIQKYKTHGTISLLPGSCRPCKLTHEMQIFLFVVPRQSIPLVPDKSLLHDPMRNCKQAQL